MKMSVDILPDNCDGLSRIQRAILRYFAARPAPIKCSALQRQLLAAPQCPDDIAFETIDATLLLMSHPALCHRPLIDYKGNIGTDDGWIPGPGYREVAPGIGFFALLSAEGPSEISDLWSPTPLPLLAPACLLLGCASWELEVDDEFPPDNRDQATRRLRCIALHCLSNKISVLLRCLGNYHERGDITEYLAFLDRTRTTAIGCFEAKLQELLYAGPERVQPEAMLTAFYRTGS